MNSTCLSTTSRIADGILIIFSQSSYRMVNKLPLLPIKPLQYLVTVLTISEYILTAKNCITLSWITLMKPFNSLKVKKMKHIFVIPAILFYVSISFTVLFTQLLKNGVRIVIAKKTSYRMKRKAERHINMEIRYRKTLRGDEKYLVLT